MIELCYFSLDQWEVKIHLLWGKCINIPHWLRDHSTNGRLQHIEELSKSKTRVGMFWLRWLILGTIDGVLEGEDDCYQWGGRLPDASEGKETWREKHKGCIFTSLIKMIEVVAFCSPRARWWARTRWSTRWRWLESQTLFVSRSSRELHSLDRFLIVASKTNMNMVNMELSFDSRSRTTVCLVHEKFHDFILEYH